MNSKGSVRPVKPKRPGQNAEPQGGYMDINQASAAHCTGMPWLRTASACLAIPVFLHLGTWPLPVVCHNAALAVLRVCILLR